MLSRELNPEAAGWKELIMYKAGRLPWHQAPGSSRKRVATKRVSGPIPDSVPYHCNTHTNTQGLTHTPPKKNSLTAPAPQITA